MTGGFGRPAAHVVLAGGGHSHLEVLRRFGMHRPPGVRLTLVAREVDAPYSGMLPGLIAGHYRFDEAHVDLRRLAASVGARFIHESVVSVDLAQGLVRCGARPATPFDLLSINVGAAPAHGAAGADLSVPVKPIARFLHRWYAVRDRIMASSTPIRLAVVGGGAGGVELMLSVQYALDLALREAGRAPGHVRYALFTQSATLVSAQHPRARQWLEEALRERGVSIHRATPIVGVAPGVIHAADGASYEADEVLWATGAAAPGWIAASGLAVDARGFVHVSDTLQSVSDPRVFAAGDCAAVAGYALEKAGVFAVRQGPVLADNLWRAARGDALRRYRPQRRFLSLVSTGDRVAVASRGAWAARGAWLWRVKDGIDRRFMRMYQMDDGRLDPPSIRMSAPSASMPRSPMRCGGCGAKVGAGVLHRVLAGLQGASRADILVGLEVPDDAAVLRVAEGCALVQTVDYFRPMLDDPYVFGQVAATHAVSDLHAMGATPRTALAVVTVPHGPDRDVEDLLRELLGGALEVFAREGIALVGGHTGEGAELGLGFTVNGEAPPASLLRKGGLRPHDAIVLTKAIGTGALFAADMQRRAKGRWIAAALESMLRSNGAAAGCLRVHGAQACTDVTGFGLMGHLLEMAQASGVAVDLVPGAVQHLAGAAEVVAAGVRSTLYPQNAVAAGAAVERLDPRLLERPDLALLFDPQTAGGLLAGVPRAQAAACVHALRGLGYGDAAVIGSVRELSHGPSWIRLVEGGHASPRSGDSRA